MLFSYIHTHVYIHKNIKIVKQIYNFVVSFDLKCDFAFQEVQLFLGNVPSLMNSSPQKLSNPSFRLRFAFKGDLRQCSSCWFWFQLKIVKKSWHTITSSCLLSPAQMTFPSNHALTMIAIVFMKNPWISYFSSSKKNSLNQKNYIKNRAGHHGGILLKSREKFSRDLPLGGKRFLNFWPAIFP